MFEKVNPSHPDKIADRIAGAIVDLAYKKNRNPKIAVEVLIGHKVCNIICETDIFLLKLDVKKAVWRITGDNSIEVIYKEVNQDSKLSKNQSKGICCGDNGIFKGLPTTDEQNILTNVAKVIYRQFPYDGKYILNLKYEDLIICQSHAKTKDLEKMFKGAHINPIGDWTGGTSVDTGATNRKLGSDMGDAVTGGGLHGKDLSKADVSVNIYCYLLARKYHREVKAYCAIGDKEVMIEIKDYLRTIQRYIDIVKDAKQYIKGIGGFEKLAEWGLIR